jgi:hypothetical protein
MSANQPQGQADIERRGHSYGLDNRKKSRLSGSHSCRAHRALWQKLMENFSKTRCALIKPYFPPRVGSVFAKGVSRLALRVRKEAFFRFGSCSTSVLSWEAHTCALDKLMCNQGVQSGKSSLKNDFPSGRFVRGLHRDLS